jgi:hypothetical protein
MNEDPGLEVWGGVGAVAAAVLGAIWRLALTGERRERRGSGGAGGPLPCLDLIEVGNSAAARERAQIALDLMRLSAAIDRVALASERAERAADRLREAIEGRDRRA